MVVIGGGISGVACARRLHAAGLPVRLLERGHRLGGRMASRTEQVNGRTHPVDIGAPYFTVRESRFADVVTALEAAGLARKWTDTFTLAGPNGRTGETAGPQRWSSTRGLRALVEALATDGSARDGSALDIRLETEVTRVEYDSTTGAAMVDGEPAAAVVLAMPDPQAARLLPSDLADQFGVSGRDYAPVLAVWAGWPDRWWPAFDGIFVADSEVLSWVADSGRSRGDAADVLVAHTTPGFAAAYLRGLADPVSAIQPVFTELRRVIGAPVPPPEWERVHRWSLASSRQPHAEPFLLADSPVGGASPGLIGICGDAWGPRSRVEQAWSSGDGLAGELIKRLTVSF
ncbi:MAG TPA: FAD-dependent oxidoreductase [Kineosporiaceae bacterium]|nr:FAD-dependent oxidoreductase [Kineosporiaceae bacterium]